MSWPKMIKDCGYNNRVVKKMIWATETLSLMDPVVPGVTTPKEVLLLWSSIIDDCFDKRNESTVNPKLAAMEKAVHMISEHW